MTKISIQDSIRNILDNYDLDFLFDGLSIGVALIDEKGKIEAHNSTILSVLGITEDEIESSLFYNLLETQELFDLNEFLKNINAAETKSYSVLKNIEYKNGIKQQLRIIFYPFIESESATNMMSVFVMKTDSNDKTIPDNILLKAILNNFQDSIYFKDRDSRFIKVSAANLRKFGFKDESDILGKTDFDLFALEHAQKAFEDEQAIMNSSKAIISIDEKETWPDGSITWVNTSKYSLRDDKNEIIGTFGISQDITPLKEIEIKLKESEERYKNLSSVTFEGILIHENGVCVDANKSFLNMMDYSISEIKGKNLIKMMVKEEYHSIIEFNMKNNVTAPYEVVGIRKNKTEFIAELESRQMSYMGKEVRVVAVRDVTQRKNAQKRQNTLYKISEAVSEIDDIDNLYKRIHEIIQNLMPAPNFYIALFDKEKNTLSFPYFVDQFDDPPETREFGRGLTEYILRTDQDMLIDAAFDQQLRDTGETDAIGVLCKIWLGVRLKVKDNLIGAIVLQDYEKEGTYGEQEKEILIFVSEQIALAIDKKRSEDQLKKYSTELKELVASKDKFFSIVAHDLKSPFTALLGYSEMIANEYNEMTQEELKEFATNMNEVAKKTFSLLENLLEWSRIQTGRMKYTPENISLFKTVQKVFDLNIENARAKGVTLKNRINPLYEVSADSNMLFTILRNLTSNAVKFTRSGDEITIVSKKINDMMEITVHDTGIGIKEEHLKLLFKTDVHNSEIGTEQEKGTGLGLILCKELVEKNGGKIHVESLLGNGSSFIFTVPLSSTKVMS